MTDLEKSIANVPKVFEAGRENFYDEFWDNFQNYGKRNQYSGAFNMGANTELGYGWTDKTFNPKYPLTIRYGNNIFNNNKDITRINQIIDLSTANSGQFSNGCTGCTNIKSIKKIIVNGAPFNENSFNKCSSLEYVIFEGENKGTLDLHWSPLLKASIESAVAVLSDDVTGKTLSLNQNAVNTAFETAEGLADGSTSAEWIALRGTKTNWTISLL